MQTGSALIAYDSRTGHTAEVARTLQRELRCDIERILDRKSREGFIGYLRPGFDAKLHRTTSLRPMLSRVEDHALVVVGTPVWSGTVATPVRTYLRMNRSKLRDVAFIVTCGDGHAHRALGELEELAQRAPRAVLVLRDRDVTKGCEDRVRSFARTLDRAMVYPVATARPSDSA